MRLFSLCVSNLNSAPDEALRLPIEGERIKRVPAAGVWSEDENDTNQCHSAASRDNVTEDQTGATEVCDKSSCTSFGWGFQVFQFHIGKPPKLDVEFAFLPSFVV